MDQMSSVVDRAGQSAVVDCSTNAVSIAVRTAEEMKSREHSILEIIGDLLRLGTMKVGDPANEKTDAYLGQVRKDIDNLLLYRGDKNVRMLNSRSADIPDIPRGAPEWFGIQAPPSRCMTEPASILQSEGAEGEVVAVRGIRILIAEDDPTSLGVALAQLSKLGYRVEGVANGAEAIESLKHGTYDLVLMDCQMPVMDGYEATRHIRQSHTSAIPIIAVTAHVLPGDLARCTRSGMNGFLPKPLDLSRLAATIAKWCPLSSDSVNAANNGTTSNMDVLAFDPGALLGRLAGDEHLAKTILTGFLDAFPSQLHNLRELFLKADRKAVRLQAHALMGSSATVGASNLCALAQNLEGAAEEGELDYFDELLRRSQDEFERLQNAADKAGWLTNNLSTAS